MNIDFIKCHGTGNDFILIDEISNNYSFTEEQRNYLAITLCDRKKSIGADGMLYVLKSKEHDGHMRIFNADGTEPEMCGNGLRCVGRYLLDLLNKEKITVETMKASYEVKAFEDLYSGVRTVEIEINTVNFDTASLPLICNERFHIEKPIPELSEQLSFTAVSITNPHLVTFVDEIDITQIEEIGIKANSTKSILPQGVNVNFVRVLSEDSIYVKTYERGVGLTKSCGTGMTASTVVYCLKNPMMHGRLINIYNDGGMIKIAVNKSKDNKYSIRFIGNASYIFKASVSLDKGEEPQVNDKIYLDNEISSYNKFLEACNKAK